MKRNSCIVPIMVPVVLVFLYCPYYCSSSVVIAIVPVLFPFLIDCNFVQFPCCCPLSYVPFPGVPFLGVPRNSTIAVPF